MSGRCAVETAPVTKFAVAILISDDLDGAIPDGRRIAVGSGRGAGPVQMGSNADPVRPAAISCNRTAPVLRGSSEMAMGGAVQPWCGYVSWQTGAQQGVGQCGPQFGWVAGDERVGTGPGLPADGD